MSIASSTPDPAARQAKVNAVILAAASALNGSIAPITVTLGGIAGAYLLGPDKSLATAPVAGLNVGLALGALPAAALMRRVGRRLGLAAGAAVGIAGALIAAGGIGIHAFWVFVAGTLTLGVSLAFVQQYRFAAADTGSEAFRAKAISWVLLGGVATAIIGPQTVIFAGDLLPVPYAGAYVGAAVLCALGLAVLWGLGGEARFPPRADPVHGAGRPIGEIVRQPKFVVAVISAIASFGLMALLMTAAPLAMVGHGHSQHDAALGIQWHVLAMFAPSFITGSLIARFGAGTIIAVGMILLLSAGLVGIAGFDLMNFWVGLIVLGVGWNFGFIGATALLTTTYTPAERGRVQGLNDFLVFGFVAVASLASGSLLTASGWATVNAVVFPVVAISLIGLGWLALVSRKKDAAPVPRPPTS
jgi:MFS family permease